MSSIMASSSRLEIGAPAFTMLYSCSPEFRNTFTRVMPSTQTGKTSHPRSRAPSTIKRPENPAKKPRMLDGSPKCCRANETLSPLPLGV